MGDGAPGGGSRSNGQGPRADELCGAGAAIGCCGGDARDAVADRALPALAMDSRCGDSGGLKRTASLFFPHLLASAFAGGPGALATGRCGCRI